jgi:tRNA(Leu) C34 or U34 (ribose-2'-O)-methylase TrmL
MVERSNGEILVMCLLDAVPTTLDLNLLMAEVELALKQPLQATGDSHGVEQLFETALGLRVSFDNVSLEHSAAGFYANAVVVAERRSAGVTGAVWKTAAGALSHVPVCQVVNITRTITDLQEKGFFAIALDGDGDMNLDQVDPDLANRPLILVIGAEGRGVSRLVAQTCDLRVQIPMSKKIESLNAAVATGVALYSITRSRKLD